MMLVLVVMLQVVPAIAAPEIHRVSNQHAPPPMKSDVPPPSLPPPSPLPETDWLSKAGHGVFTHFLNGLQNEFGRNSQGLNSSWDDCVVQFDVEAFAADAAATGAKYAFITLMQVEKFMIAPNARFDALTGYKPGEACATRDLVLDLHAALDKRGLKLGLYWTGDGPRGDPKAAAGMGTDNTPPGRNIEFVKRWSSVLQEYSERYGNKVFGWWLDGCYFSAGAFGYNDTTLKYYHDAIRAGNPQAVLGFNNAPQPVIASGEPWQHGGETSKWEDMTAGETNSFNDFGVLPTSRWVVGPTANGLPAPFQKTQELTTVQWHELTFMGSQWAAPGLCTCSGALAPNCSVAGCQAYGSDNVKAYSQALKMVGAALTVDLQLLRNGSMNREQVATLRSAWDDRWICAANHGNSTCCCGQSTKCCGGRKPCGGVVLGEQCPADQPVCSGFVYGSTYGTCVAKLKTDDDAPVAETSNGSMYQYELYRPTIDYGSVVTPLTSSLQYNHDSSIALFKSVWISVWNANVLPDEGKAGQYNVMSTSTDLKTWTTPVHAFSDPAHATNPVPCSASSCTQWQPNLFLMKSGKLGCVWSGSNGRDGRVDGNAMVTYLSTLDNPKGKWTNQAIIFESGKVPSKPFFDDANWTLFASQNPAILRSSGRILAPVVMTSSRLAADANPGCKLAHVPHNVSQMCFERRSSVLISDDDGLHWHESQGTVIAKATWAQWEPTVWAPSANGSDVFMISRFNDFRLTSDGGPAADHRMQRATSSDSGQTWSPLTPLPLDTVCSRMQVMAQRSSSGDVSRFLMVMNDVNPLGVRGTAGRLNVALYLSPIGAPEIAAFAFAPGAGLSAPHEIAMYPQMWQDKDRLAVVWSSGDIPRGIRVASLSLPATDKLAVSIRNNSYFQDSRPEVVEGKWLRFYGQERLQTAVPIELQPSSPWDDRVASAGGWLRLKPTLGRSGTLLDTRGAPKGGFIFGVKAKAANWTSTEGDYLYAPYVWLGGHASEGITTNVELPHGSVLTHFCTRAVHEGHVVYMGFSVNASAGRACFFCAANGAIQEESVQFNSSKSFGSTSWPAVATKSNVTVGYKNLPYSLHSSITGLIADMGSLALFGKMLTTREHAALANAQGKALGVPLVHNASGWIPASADAALWLDGASATPSTLQHQFPQPLPTRADKPSVDSSDGQTLLRLCQNSSASVELPPVTCETGGPGLRASMRFRLQSAAVTPTAGATRRFTVLTVGDGESHVRLVTTCTGETCQMRLTCSISESQSVLVPMPPLMEAWTTIEIQSVAGGVSVNGERCDCACASGGLVWMFLGEGFLDRSYLYSSDCVQHDVSALQTSSS